MNQPTLFPVVERLPGLTNKDIVKTVSTDQAEILAWIIKLHNGGQPFDLDPCYNVGSFWTGLPKPRIKMDLEPRTEGVIQADVRAIPLASKSINSVMFDPPFLVRRGTLIGDPYDDRCKIKERYGVFDSKKALEEMYCQAFDEFQRVVKRSGLMVLKVQDTSNRSEQIWTHFDALSWADDRNFRLVDLFISVKGHVAIAPNLERQRVARKVHCYFMVFRKGITRGDRKSPAERNQRSAG